MVSLFNLNQYFNYTWTKETHLVTDAYFDIPL